MMTTTTQQAEALARNNVKINPELLVLDKQNEDERKDVISNMINKITHTAESLED